MKELICSSPFFGITISIAAYSIGVWINKKTKSAVCNPLLISYLIIIPVLMIFSIPLEWYNRGGDIINMFLSPATAVLAITIYRQRELVRKHLPAVIAGSVAGSASSIAIVWLLCRLFALDSVDLSALFTSIFHFAKCGFCPFNLCGNLLIFRIFGQVNRLRKFGKFRMLLLDFHSKRSNFLL